MPFVVIGKDKAGGELRRNHRADHLDFIAGHQAPVIYAGPLMENGRMVGSLFVLDVESREALGAHLARDPYFAAGVFETVEVYESKWMVPEREPGSLRREADRARAEQA